MVVNIDCKHGENTVQVNMDIQGENRHLEITGEGPSIYEALGACIAALMREQGSERIENDLKITWVHCMPHVEEWTVIQEMKDGQPISVRWGTSLFADLFEPVYQYLKGF